MARSGSVLSWDGGSVIIEKPYGRTGVILNHGEIVAGDSDGKLAGDVRVLASGPPLKTTAESRPVRRPAI